MGSCLSSCEDGLSDAPNAKGRDVLDSKALETLEAQAKRDEELVCVPSRFCSNGSSNVASVYTQQGKKGTNQDCMIVWQDFGCREDTVFCGVFDGHGPYGHLVAKRVRDSLPSTLIEQLQEVAACGESGDKESVSNHQEDLCEDEAPEQEECSCEDDEPQMFSLWKESHLRAFKVMDKELKLHPTLDCFCSGTTAITVIKQGQDLVIANVGDSRAILGTKAEDNTMTAVQLTVDLKPNLPQEAERIKQCRGRVFALQDEPEVHRVWLPNDDSPGLAMARAFGDFCLKDYGVIAVPEVTYRRLNSRDQFIVLATDGIWDVLSNQEVVRIVSSAPTRVTAAKVLVESAVRAWRRKFPTSKIDDCAAVCLYLDSQAHSQGTPDSAVQSESDISESKEMSLTEKPTCQVECSNVLDSQQCTENGKKLQQNTGKEGGKSLKECIATDEWSALDGLTRVNSILSLPRVLGKDSRARRKKWFG